MHMFVNDAVELIFCLGGKYLLDVDCEGYFESEDEENDNLEIKL